MGEADDPDERAGRKIRFEILGALVVYPMILFHVGCKGCRLDYVGVVSADGAQGAADILAALSQLRSHIAPMNRLGIYFADSFSKGLRGFLRQIVTDALPVPWISRT